MAEAVLNTPPGSPIPPVKNRKRLSGGSATAMLLAAPPSGYNLVDPEDANLKGSDPLGFPIEDSAIGGVVRRGSNSSRRGSGSSASQGTLESDSYFPRRQGSTTHRSNTDLHKLFQHMPSDYSPPKPIDL